MDLLVKLYALDFSGGRPPIGEDIAVHKACIVDKTAILDFVRTHFPQNPSWVHECEYALMNSPVSCYVAVKNREIIGFSCYDATCKGFFGPTGVRGDFRRKGVGRELLMRALESMKESGYAYAVIGWAAPDAVRFYKNAAGALEIDDSPPNKSIYKNSLLVD